jgi:serine phosphatase RsbU (regulator of sigma subunit)
VAEDQSTLRPRKRQALSAQNFLDGLWILTFNNRHNNGEPGLAEAGPMADSDTQDPKASLRLQKLIEANQKLAQVESVKDLIPLFLCLAIDVTSAESSSFLVFDPRKEVLLFSDIKGREEDGCAESILKNAIEIPLGVGIAGWVAKEKRPLIVKDVMKDPRFFGAVDESSGFVTRSLLGVPVLYGDELLGVIEVLNPIGKPNFDEADMDLMTGFANIAAVAIFRARLLEEKLHQQRLEIQMETAARLQSLFRPKSPKVGFGTRIWAVSVPARVVGGDFYDIIPLTDGSWLIYVADVADKGLPAALVMAAMWILIRNECHSDMDVARLLAKLNATLYNLIAGEGYFVTICMGRYWPVTGKLEMASGGHPAAIKNDGKSCRYLTGKRGPALGLYRVAAFGKEAIVLRPGESILFTTDGVSETRNADGSFFGEERMLATIESLEGPPCGPALLRVLRSWQGDAEPSDDITMLEIWRESGR